MARNNAPLIVGREGSTVGQDGHGIIDAAQLCVLERIPSGVVGSGSIGAVSFHITL